MQELRLQFRSVRQLFKDVELVLGFEDLFLDFGETPLKVAQLVREDSHLYLGCDFARHEVSGELEESGIVLADAMDEELKQRHLGFAYTLDVTQLVKQIHLESLGFAFGSAIVQVVAYFQYHGKYLFESLVISDASDCSLKCF